MKSHSLQLKLLVKQKLQDFVSTLNINLAARCIDTQHIRVFYA